MEESDKIYQFRVRVTDSGLPPLSDTTAVYYYVMTLRVTEFHLGLPAGTNRIVASSVFGVTIAGQRYRLQYKDRLDTPVWTDVGEPVLSDRYAVSLRDPTATNATQRFYRVVLVP